jgi:hypothetical protein
MQNTNVKNKTKKLKKSSLLFEKPKELELRYLAWNIS